MRTNRTYTVTILLDVNDTQDVDDRAESRSYLVADGESGEAVIIDSVIENVERDIRIVKELGLTLLFAVETHVHADHITGASLLKDRTGARIVYGGGAAGAVTGADLFLYDGEELRFGRSSLQALATPGHTDGCTSYVLPGAVFTGDTLFIRGNGRTDLQGGSAATLFESVRTSCLRCRTTRSSIPATTTTAESPPLLARKSDSTNGSISRSTKAASLN